MSLIKRSTWPLLGNGSWLSDFFDTEKFFDSDWMKNFSIPAVNVRETDKSFDVEVAAPGLSKKDFKITSENGLLTISSEKKEEKEEKENDYTRKEFNYSTFSRTFTLPENINEDDIKATYEDGILKLKLSKKMISQPKAQKAIEVR
ncbi:Hsp20/alpha crystallin family protein [Chryseolinea lacunae]|uniref:Hsp20/alpha crystallin family protein n=1 Tax=Chryseolinea lacunae TaxID=2801331 RepID=UPI001F24E780|nr:Hsp20/alpha crystallin family protein [Chryseolinea lacunae]